MNWIPLAASLLVIAAGSALASDSTDPLTGLPVVPNAHKTEDPVQSYRYCGKNAQANAYLFGGLTDNEDEDAVASAKAWYLKNVPHAVGYTADSGLAVVITQDGTSAVVFAGAIISFLHFSPGLSPAEMKGLGSSPSSRECHPS
jgi:hypothetical protein